LVKRTTARRVVVVCALALACTPGAGVASAEPDLTPFIPTTCTYSQAEAALNALSPDSAKEFSANPMAQTWLHAFLDAPVGQRQQLIQQAPELQPYTALSVAIANNCKNYPAV
jgi:hemophore-related protein